MAMRTKSKPGSSRKRYPQERNARPRRRQDHSHQQPKKPTARANKPLEQLAQKHDVIVEIYAQAKGIPRLMNSVSYECLLEIYRQEINVVDMSTLAWIIHKK
jgi:hypothetical protein